MAPPVGVVLLLWLAPGPRDPTGPISVPAPDPSATSPENQPGADDTPDDVPTDGPRASTSTEAIAPAPPRSRPWTAGGFVDVSYAFNSNAPDNHVYRGTNTTPRTNEFTIPAAGAYLLRAPDRIPIRFELGLHAGAAVDTLYAAEPVPGGDEGRAAGADVWKHLALANAGVRADRTGTEIGAGLFPGPMGIGGFWSRGNWNYTPSWESNAAPFYMAGARLRQDIAVGSLEAWVVNGWQMLADSNAQPSYIFGTSLGKRDLTFGQWVYFGPEQRSSKARSWRVHTDTLIGYDVRRGGVMAVWDFGQEQRIDLPGDPRHLWTGGALFARVRPMDRKNVKLDFAFRPEAWWDRDGVMFGADQWLFAGTGTATVDLYGHLQIRAEYRYDRSTRNDGYWYTAANITDDHPDLARDQHILFIAFVGYFEHVFAMPGT